jgi:hypothetical protein
MDEKHVEGKIVHEVKVRSGKIIDAARDAARGAMKPGKRVSHTGNLYWETRFNRSDKKPGKI